MFARSTLGETPSSYSAETYAWAQTCAPTGELWHDLRAAFDGNCFAFSPDTWGVIAALKPPPPPPAVKPPADLTTPPANQAQAEATINAVLADQMRRWQAQNQQFFNSLPDVSETNNTALWLAAAAAGVALILILRR